MKIRFNRNDVLDTKNIEGEGADISGLEDQVNGLSETVDVLSSMLEPDSLPEGSAEKINNGMISLYGLFGTNGGSTLMVDSNGFVKLDTPSN